MAEFKTKFNLGDTVVHRNSGAVYIVVEVIVKHGYAFLNTSYRVRNSRSGLHNTMLEHQLIPYAPNVVDLTEELDNGG